MAIAQPRRKPGPKPQGPTKPTPTYLPLDLHEEVEALAKRDGIARSRVMTRLVAEALGRRAPAYCYPTTTEQQELELPLNRAS